MEESEEDNDSDRTCLYKVNTALGTSFAVETTGNDKES